MDYMDTVIVALGLFFFFAASVVTRRNMKETSELQSRVSALEIALQHLSK